MKSWKRKLRMGMVGGGQDAFIGAVHRMAAALDQQIEFVAGCFSRDFENTKITGKELYLDLKRCYATFEEMAENESKLPDDERIDFVSIVTPNASHFSICKAFLEAGIHVVCDKPMTCTIDEAEQLASLVKKTGLVFALTHNYTGHPLVRHARNLFRTGQMGDVRKVIVQYLQDFMMYPHEKEGHKQAAWRVDPKQSGLVGTIGDCGTHAENLLEYITGEEISELCADFSTFLPDRTLDEDANVLIRLKGGGKGLITVSQIATGEENNLRIKVYASKGAIIWEQENPNYLHVYRYNQPREILTRASEYLSEAAANATRIPTGHPEGYLEAFANIYVGVVNAIRSYINGTPLQTVEYEFPTVYDGLRGVRFTNKAAESAQKGSTWLKT